MSDIYDVIIVGAGPAGYTAGIYAKRSGLKVGIVEGYAAGGALMTTTTVENFPSHENIMGPDLMMLMRDQAENLGVELLMEQVEKLELTEDIKTITTDEQELKAKSVILATGSQYRKLGIHGEEEYSGRGVSYCATCDGFFFKGKDIVVIGGGDSAMEEAIYLSKIAHKVTIINRSENFRASNIMLEKAKNIDNIEIITSYTPNKIIGTDDNTMYNTHCPENHNGVTALEVIGTITGDVRVIECEAVFIAIGHEPRNELFNTVITVDDNGYVVTEGKTTVTNVQGVFAAGDLADNNYQQAITAAGSGCKAALDAKRYLT